MLYMVIRHMTLNPYAIYLSQLDFQKFRWNICLQLELGKITFMKAYEDFAPYKSSCMSVISCYYFHCSFYISSEFHMLQRGNLSILLFVLSNIAQYVGPTHWSSNFGYKETKQLYLRVTLVQQTKHTLPI